MIKNQNKDTDNENNSFKTFQLFLSDLISLNEPWGSKNPFLINS